jgi:hypothetical protein
VWSWKGKRVSGSSREDSRETHESVAVSRPRDRDANGQKDEAKRHVYIAAIPREVDADRRHFPAVRTPSERVRQCVELQGIDDSLDLVELIMEELTKNVS